MWKICCQLTDFTYKTFKEAFSCTKGEKKKGRGLIVIFNWVEGCTLFSGRIWFPTWSFTAVPFQNVVKIFFPALKECLSTFLSSSKKNQQKHLKFRCLEKNIAMRSETSCWKHLFSLQDRDSDRCIYFKGKKPYSICTTARKKTLMIPTPVALERELHQLKQFMCKE